MTPFLYPQSKHRRTQAPPAYIKYQNYKPYLRQEFSAKCVYCCYPDGIKGADSFGVDHYRPKSKFPEFETHYPNLFYACNCCNRRKGNFWPTPAEDQLGSFVPNPCDHVMFTHMRYRGAIVEPRTKTGRFAVKLLLLNDDESVGQRETVNVAIKSIQEIHVRQSKTLAAIESRLNEYPNDVQLLQEKEKNEERLHKLERSLARLGVPNS
jgi:hypothetical protein